MKKYLFIIAAAATCMLAACTKEIKENVSEEVITEETPSALEQKPGWTYIGANNNENSIATSSENRASIAGSAADDASTFSWNTGDKIAVYSGSTYHISDGLANNYDGTNSAVFAFEGEIDADRADFAVFPAALVHNGSSVRPGSASNHTAASLKITLPASYTLAEVQGNVSPIPMIADNAPHGNLVFKSVCALVRITVKNIAWDAKSIKVRFPGQKVQGEFTLENFVAGTNGVVGAASSVDGDDVITITNLGITEFTSQLIINVPVPMGTFNNVVVGVYDESDLIINYISTPVKVDGESVPQTWMPGRKARRLVTADLPVFTAWGYKVSSVNTASPYVAGTQVGLLSGFIGRSDKKTIVFAPGNLQARLKTCPAPNSSSVGDADIVNYGTADEWRFAEHQYDAIGATPANSMQDPQVGDWIDLFSWMGNDATAEIKDKDSTYKYGISFTANVASEVSSTNAYHGETVSASLWYDWGHNEIKYGADKKYKVDAWRTPTMMEIMTVLNRRYKGSSGATALTPLGVKAQIKVSDSQTVCGVIIFPDNFSLPYNDPAIVINKPHGGNSTKWQPKDNQAICSENEYELEVWEKLEGAGCVFLPLTYTRRYNKNSVVSYSGDGWYWSSTTRTGRYINALAFNDLTSPHQSGYSSSASNLRVDQQAERQWGLAVRLVRYVKPE